MRARYLTPMGRLYVLAALTSLVAVLISAVTP
jgi:hypothetical protein